MSDYVWLTEHSKNFLERDYLLLGQTVDQRIDIICNTAEKILNKSGFAKAFKENIKRGWYSLRTPIWTNFGTDRGSPISCFGSHISDNMESILFTQAEVGMMTKGGGGTSAYFGDIRPRGAKIKDNGESSGSVHFMQLFDSLINIVGQGKCYIEGTEVLTDSGFKDFRNVNSKDRLAEVDENNGVYFTSKYELVVEDFDGELVCFSGKKTEDSISLKVTPNHRMVILRRKMEKRKRYWSNETETILAKDIKMHRDNRFILGGWAGMGEGLNDIERLRIAYQADGIKDGENRKIKFHFKKNRKIERMFELLKRAKIKYSTHLNSDETLNISFDYSADIKKETFEEWVCLDTISGTWAQEFLDELSHWDSRIVRKSSSAVVYVSTVKSNVDIVQAIAALADKKTRLWQREAYGNRKTLYSVCISDNAYRGGESVKVTNEYYKGKVYCAVVPKGRLIVRYQGRVMVCGNTRRGNFAAYLPIDHKDINEFLEIRREGNPIQDLSFGVCVPDKFMQDMIDGDAGKRKIWAKVLESRANTGYPYICFIDNVNNNTVDVYKEKKMRINHSNLCVTGDQRVVSDRGLKTVRELYEEGGNLKLFDNDKIVSASPMKLIEKDVKVYKVALLNGMTHTITDYHKVKIRIGTDQNGHAITDMVSCSKLNINDKVAIQTNKGIFGEKDMQDEAFLLGMYQADGTQHKDLIMLDIWENDFDLISEIEEKFSRVFYRYGNNLYHIVNQYGITKGFREIPPPQFLNCIVNQSKVKKKRLTSKCLKKSLGFKKDCIPSWIWESNENTQWQYIRGLFYADGTVNVSSSKGCPVQLALANINKKFLQDIQLILANLGMQTSIRILREAGETLLPDGKGGEKFYKTKDCWRLIIGNKNDVLTFNKNTGFLDRKEIFIEDREYRDNTKKFYGVESIEYIGREDVYCTTVESDEHTWICNGVVTSNCSEIMLPDCDEESFVCDLSSMNILHYDAWKDTNAVELLTYFLDAVMTEFIEKARKLNFMERTVRFAERHRALGIGWLGYHSYLQSKMIPFESLKAQLLNIEVAKNIKEKAYAASAKLAKEYGEPEVLKGYGRRNTTLCAIAPTKSSAWIMGQVSEGIEPEKTNHYIKDLQKGKYTVKNKFLEQLLEKKGHNTDEVWNDILKKGGSVQHLEILNAEEKAVFKTFSEISPKEIVVQASQRQKYIDQSQSLNLMIHPSIPAKDINSLLINAWKLGVKSLYYQMSVNAAQVFSRNILDCVSCSS